MSKAKAVSVDSVKLTLIPKYQYVAVHDIPKEKMIEIAKASGEHIEKNKLKDDKEEYWVLKIGNTTFFT